MSRVVRQGAFAVVIAAAVLCAMVGCELPPPKLPPVVLPHNEGVDSVAEHVTVTLEAEPPPFVDGNTSESAMAQTALMPPVADLRIQQEILLHAVMYRAAYESNVGNIGRFVIEPVQEELPPNLGVDPADFRLRVLAELAGLGVPVAWTPSTWQAQSIDYFPGTNERATRLIIVIINRDEEQATVFGEIGDRTAGASSSRQKVIATWDGVQWNVERDRVRVVW